MIKTFCDGFSRPLEKHDFVSTGNSLVVNFLSVTGSYSGSSLQYWAQYDFFDASTGIIINLISPMRYMKGYELCR